MKFSTPDERSAGTKLYIFRDPIAGEYSSVKVSFLRYKGSQPGENGYTYRIFKPGMRLVAYGSCPGPRSEAVASVKRWLSYPLEQRRFNP